MSCAPKLCQSGTPTMVPGSQHSYLFVWCPLLSSAGAESETTEEEGDGGAKWLEPRRSMKELPRAKVQDPEPKYLFPIRAVSQTLGFPPGKLQDWRKALCLRWLRKVTCLG